jgi:short-subunit dehydrogenase
MEAIVSAVTSKGTAVVTGASGGIGAIYADRLARRGYDLLLVARDVARLQQVAERLGKTTAAAIEVMAADLTSRADVLRLEDRLRTDPRITALVNNAGVGATASLLDSKVDEMESMIQLNVTTLTRLTLAVLPGLVDRGHGTIVNISSIAAVAPEILNGVYSASKSYVVVLTQSLHNEVGDKGIQVQAVLPGATGTAFWARAGVPVEHLPQHIVMSAEEMVDAALSGLDQRELVTIPSLPNAADWTAYDSARLALKPNLSHTNAASRYRPTPLQ